MNPVCGNCHREMKCIKNGVSVAPAENESHKRDGDEFQCPSCKSTVVVGFGNAYHSPDTHADLVLVTE